MTPPVLPDFQRMFPEHFSTEIRMERIVFNRKFDFLSHKSQTSLGELFVGFLKYYANFDPEKYGVAMGRVFERMDDELYFTRESNSRYQPFLIQDPFDLRNTARAINTKKQLKVVMKAFEHSAKVAEAGKVKTFNDFCKKEESESVILKDSSD